jgi:8-oxo-dGTP pyrophosphatase MutT (NUDIX family)
VELSRHHTATCYVVEGDATALHDHKRIDRWLPPGGHLDRGELPHEAALREAREETGLDVELVAERGEVASATVEPLPRPEHFQLADVNVHDGEVTHQHVDVVYYGRADARAIDPGDDEVGADDWEWFTAAELDADGRVPEDVAAAGRRAIETVGERS